MAQGARLPDKNAVDESPQTLLLNPQHLSIARCSNFRPEFSTIRERAECIWAALYLQLRPLLEPFVCHFVNVLKVLSDDVLVFLVKPKAEAVCLL